ncbi:energy-coupling factor transporter transmembrane component T [Streptococcus ictaluri]|uniref:Cobalt transport protein n=1 Tax=Streptococcus ictaluri 707-05 TaxID=764299 RepID=G5K1Q0_9STRE|nr:energy-coupling factor transporter transmembrane component T [Streptococcus ictaluri]EHI70121.1 cobalt transport protein [Streptococcus ictaluri 707-05]
MQLALLVTYSQNRKVSLINPLTIILINAVLPLLNTLFPSNKSLLLSFLLTTVIFMIGGQLIRLFKGLVFLMIFLAFYLLFLWLENGILVTWFRMTLLFLPCFFLAWFLYSSSEVLAALQRLHLPKYFIVSLMICLRYIMTFQKEYRLIRDALRVRGIVLSVRHPLKAFDYLLVPQLFRCLTLSHELSIASLTKGVTAPHQRSSFYYQAFTYVDVLILFLLILGYGFVIGGVI